MSGGFAYLFVYVFCRVSVVFIFISCFYSSQKDFFKSTSVMKAKNSKLLLMERFVFVSVSYLSPLSEDSVGFCAALGVPVHRNSSSE